MILLRIKKSSDKLVKSTECLGLVKNVHVFRDLFDFSTESQSELKLFDEINSASKTYDSSSLDNIVDMLSKNNSEEFEKMDTNSFCIPPFKFSQINLPLSHRDFRSALKVNLFYFCLRLFTLLGFFEGQCFWSRKIVECSI